MEVILQHSRLLNRIISERLNLSKFFTLRGDYYEKVSNFYVF